VTYEGERFNETFLVHADSTVFDMFGIELISGDINTALSDPASVVISEDKAVKYFGSVEEAIGKVVDYDDYKKLKVTAIMENQTERSHMRMDMIVPFEVMIEKQRILPGTGTSMFACLHPAPS